MGLLYTTFQKDSMPGEKGVYTERYFRTARNEESAPRMMPDPRRIRRKSQKWER